MFLRWVTAAYLAYLAVPIALLLTGSFGELWLNTILPTGLTTQWYRDVAADPSFRRAFTASLAVVAITCAACAAIGLPLAYAVFRTESPRVRALARVLYQMPVALPPLVLAFGFILVFSSDTLPWLGSIWLLAAGHVVLALPYFLQTVVADMQRLGLRTLEDAAESLGSRGWQRFAHIVLPALRQSILAGLIMGIAIYPLSSLRGFEVAIPIAAGAVVYAVAVLLLRALSGDEIAWARRALALAR